MRLLKNVKLTTTQQQMIALAGAAVDDESVEMPSDINAQAALATLMKWGVVSKSGEQLSLTQAGIALGKHQGLIDDSGRPTDKATKLLPPELQQGAAGGTMPLDAGGFDFEEPAAGGDGNGEAVGALDQMPPEENEEQLLTFLKRFTSPR
mgnify:FL=1